MNAEDCTRFYDETSNGLVYGKDSKGRELCVFVELSKDVDVVGGLLHGWMASGVTRCVRAVGVEADWDMNGLLKIAERKNRKVEKIVDGQNAGGVSIYTGPFLTLRLKINNGRRVQSCFASAESRTQCSSRQHFPGTRSGSTVISITSQTRMSILSLGSGPTAELFYRCAAAVGVHFES